LKRKTRALLERAQDSLVLGIELFNRPQDAGRTDGVLFCLDHAFEMLLKAVLFEKTGRIRGPREKRNYGFEKCLNLCQSTANAVDKDEALILRNLNGFRDAAVHDILEITEGLLYGHAQSAVQIFAAVLKKVFNKELSKTLPRRILPIATTMPGDITTVISEDLEGIRKLLGKGKRQEDDAEARLRAYMVIENNIREVQGVTHPAATLSKTVRNLKMGDWKSVLPMVAGLVQSTPGGIPISLHVSKREGFPVRIDPKAPTAIAFRYVKPEDKYPYLTGELSKKLGTSPSRVIAFVKMFQMKGNDEYHTGIRVSTTGRVQRYSDKAREVLAAAIAKEGVDKLWTEAKAGTVLDPIAYAPLPNPITLAAGAAATTSVANGTQGVRE
jgi:hypothetical protein